MIRGLHGMIYSSDADASRDFARDKLKLPFTDVGGGWLIFDLPLADIGFHPADSSGRAKPGSHDVSLFCDDIKGTVKDLQKRGVKFKAPIADHGYGYVTYLDIPGGITIQLYEPKYQKGSSGSKKRAAKKKAAKKPAAKKKAAKKNKKR